MAYLVLSGFYFRIFAQGAEHSGLRNLRLQPVPVQQSRQTPHGSLLYFCVIIFVYLSYTIRLTPSET